MRAMLIMLVLVLAGTASADAIDVPQCEHGWIAQHHGHSASCAPPICTTDAECGSGHCVDVARCFRTQPMDTGRTVLPPGAPQPTYEAPIDALCAADGSCAAEAHCAHERECTAPPTHGGLCSVGHAGAPSSTFALIALALLVTAAARRR